MGLAEICLVRVMSLWKFVWVLLWGLLGLCGDAWMNLRV